MSEKRGYNGSIDSYGKLTRWGDQGEYYCRSLYGLAKHPNGERRPDLISINGSYKPKLSMEVKTSRQGRGVVHPHGLTYGLTKNLDYISLFGDDLPREDPQGEFEDIQYNRLKNLPAVSFYYNLMLRTDNLSTENLKHKFSDLGMTFGDQFIIPHELVSYNYIIGKMQKKGISFDEARRNVGDIIKSFLTKGYDYQNTESSDTQEIHFNDFLSLYMNDETLLSEQGKRRVELLRENYGDDRLSALEKIEYIGPNHTNIYAFYKPEDSELFMDQIRQRIGTRRDILTRLTRQRLEEAATMLEGYSVQEDQIQFLHEPGNHRVLTKNQESRLERLLCWRHADDNGPEFTDLHPRESDSEYFKDNLGQGSLF